MDLVEVNRLEYSVNDVVEFINGWFVSRDFEVFIHYHNLLVFSRNLHLLYTRMQPLLSVGTVEDDLVFFLVDVLGYPSW